MEQLHRLLEQLLPPDDNGPPLVDLPSDDDGPGAHGAGPPACHYGLEALPDSDDGMPGHCFDSDDDGMPGFCNSEGDDDDQGDEGNKGDECEERDTPWPAE